MKGFPFIAVMLAIVLACFAFDTTAATNSIAFSAFNAISVTNVWSGGTTNPAFEVWLNQTTKPDNVYVTCYTKALLVQPKPQGGSLHVPGFTNITVTTWHGLTLSNTLKFAYPDCGYFRIKCTNPPPYTATFGVTCESDSVTESYVDAAAYIYFLSNGIPVRDIDVTCNPINIEQNSFPALPSVNTHVKSTKCPYNINIVDFQVFYNSAHGYMYMNCSAPIYDGQSGYRWDAIKDTLTTKYGDDYNGFYYSYGHVLALDGSTPYQLSCFYQTLSPSGYSVGNAQTLTFTYAVKQDDKVELSRLIYHFNIVPGI